MKHFFSLCSLINTGKDFKHTYTHRIEMLCHGAIFEQSLCFALLWLAVKNKRCSANIWILCIHTTHMKYIRCKTISTMLMCSSNENILSHMGSHMHALFSFIDVGAKQERKKVPNHSLAAH